MRGSRHFIHSEWSKLAAAYPQFQKLSFGCADPDAMQGFQQTLADGAFRALSEATLCISDWSHVTARTTHKVLRLRAERGCPIKQLVVFPRSNDLKSTAAVAVLDTMPRPFDLIIDLDRCAHCLCGDQKVRALGDSSTTELTSDHRDAMYYYSFNAAVMLQSSCMMGFWVHCCPNRLMYVPRTWHVSQRS